MHSDNEKSANVKKKCFLILNLLFDVSLFPISSLQFILSVFDVPFFHFKFSVTFNYGFIIPSSVVKLYIYYMFYINSFFKFDFKF